MTTDPIVTSDPEERARLLQAWAERKKCLCGHGPHHPLCPNPACGCTRYRTLEHP